MNTHIYEQLKQYFPQFDDELQKVLANKAIIKTFASDDALMRSGQYLKSTMLITKGRVKLYANGADGESYFMYFLEPGQACAMSFICALRNKTSELEAIATEETEAILIPLGMMDTLMTQHKTWYYFVLDNYRSRFQELLEALRSVAFHGMDERLEFYLHKQYKHTGQATLQLTHEAIANDLNSSRVVISRLLKQMEHDGKIKLLRNTIVLLDK